MGLINDIKHWIGEHPNIASFLKFFLWLTIIFLLIGWARRFIKRNLPDTAVKYKSQKGIEILGYLFIAIITVSYFTGSIKDFGLAIGLLTAGVTITLQELILSIAGSFYIFFVQVYKPGDRIEIQGIKGDVIDIDSIYTTMMEIGEWVSSDNYSGRIVKLSNAFVFKGPVYNYSRDFPFVWDEFDLPIKYGSDVAIAKQLVTEVAQDLLSEYVEASKTNWQQVVDKYYIEDAQVNPTLAITLTDNWIQFNLRYIVDYKKRRSTKHLLQDNIGKRILDTQGKVTLASNTLEIVEIPTVHVKTKPE